METETTAEDRRIAIRAMLLPAEGSPLWMKIDAFMVEMDEAAQRSESMIPTAEQFEVTNETEYDFADHMRVTLETEAKALNDRRLVLTRPLDDFKNAVTGATKILLDRSKAASAIWNRKALVYYRTQQEIAREAQREAEAEQRRKQEELNAAAAKREAEAAKLKTDAARARAQAEADALRRAAITTPTQMAESAPAPVSTSSNIVDKWLWEIQNWPTFCKWLGDHPEWLNEKGNNNIVVGAMKAAMNKFANHYADSIEIPGIRIWSEEAFRKKSQRG